MIQNKHIIRLSFIGLFLNIAANIILYRYFMIEEVVLKQVFDQNSYIAETYKTRVWDMHPTAISKTLSGRYTDFLQDQDFINFLRASLSFVQNSDVTVSVYDKLGNKIFTNTEKKVMQIDKYNSNSLYDKLFVHLDRYFLRNHVSNNNISDSFRGKTIHSLISRSIITDIQENITEESWVNSHIPIINSSSGKFRVEGVIRITKNITKQWDSITYLEKRIFIIFIIIFLIFFIIVMYNTNYAQRIINKQLETNRALEEAKTKAEMDSLAKTDFLANISHELRTPLNAIIGFSEIMIAETYGKIDNFQYKDYVSDINGSGKHLLSVINDILDFSKASADKLQVENVELDLNKLASSSMRFVQPRAEEVSVELIQKLPKEHVVICADPKRLKQALLNLLSNAVKFTPADGSITLSVHKNDIKNLVYVTLTDTGIGMSDKDIPKALSSFGQVDNALSRKYEGTGLGLPLTKKLVELMNGKFDLQSKQGKGTQVTLTFEYKKTIQI
ncbi:ATP-binding protein [Rickettsiaceae bacterium]|nr:ATP-binding protein [Rickettsiaceae bacterium]